MTRAPHPLHPGTRVRFRYSSRVGVVLKHEQRLTSGGRRIRVRWDATPRARECERIVSSLNLTPLVDVTCPDCYGSGVDDAREELCPTCRGRSVPGTNQEDTMIDWKQARNLAAQATPRLPERVGMNSGAESPDEQRRRLPTTMPSALAVADAMLRRRNRDATERARAARAFAVIDHKLATRGYITATEAREAIDAADA